MLRDSTVLLSLGQWEVLGTGKQRPHCGALLPGAVTTRD